jgi:hypothetical protein
LPEAILQARMPALPGCRQGCLRSRLHAIANCYNIRCAALPCIETLGVAPRIYDSTALMRRWGVIRLINQSEEEAMWPEMLRVFRRNVAPYIGMGIVFGLIAGLIFGSLLNGLIIGSTIGAMLPSVYEYARGYRFAFSLGIGISYGTMFHNVSMGILLGSVIPAMLEFVSLKKRRV